MECGSGVGGLAVWLQGHSRFAAHSVAMLRRIVLEASQSRGGSRAQLLLSSWCAGAGQSFRTIADRAMIVRNG